MSHIKKLLLLVLLLVGAFSLGTLTVKAWTHKKWIKTSETACVSNGQCGTQTGTKTITYTCEQDQSGNDTCSLGTPTYKCDVHKSIHRTNRDVSEFYNKPTGDDNHCHRIVWGDLGELKQDHFKGMHNSDLTLGTPNHPNWESAYNYHIVENPQASFDSYINPETKTDTVSCTLPEPDYSSCAPAGQCPTECGYQGGQAPDGHGGYITCSATQACQVDICPLLDGVEDLTIQTEIPSGYHKDNPEDRNCVKDQTQSSPTPAPTPEPTNPPAGGPPGPPQCGAQKPPKPGTLTAEKTSPTTVKLTWSAVTPVTYYAISYGTDPNNFQFGVPNAGNTTSFVVGALNPNLKYYFKVIAVNDCMPSDPSAVVSPGGVLGASTEKVLGASTDRLAATDSNLYLPRTMVAMVFFVLSLTSGVKFLHGWKKS